ncbi:uncharacterized protein [Choristoneura fumiferana]|uniref:uncharacterized protein n=1 Tax=Choristoneura fumiferana TaxID=7141 RepID=UPI003D155ACF
MEQQKCIITYSVLILFCNIVRAERHRFIFGHAHLPRPFLIFEVHDQTMVPSENFQVQFELEADHSRDTIQLVATLRSDHIPHKSPRAIQAAAYDNNRGTNYHN